MKTLIGIYLTFLKMASYTADALYIACNRINRYGTVLYDVGVISIGAISRTDYTSHNARAAIYSPEE